MRYRPITEWGFGMWGQRKRWVAFALHLWKKILKNKKKTVGIRIPDNNIVMELVRELGRPIITTSIHDQDDVIEYTTDPELIYEKYREFADVVIDGGYGKNEASTVVDCTSGEIDIVRQGLGILEY